ncbi:hypothetical protein GOP47_0021951 [Adiantum capillus-veneris]|uniref:UNC93-like protein 1 n=1 Tax=Adiantum capillus-veneris TaxID=13818 RepID=A0A9D4UA57_ADICA|nr:hypothetical protein GOP47_0021951 [Adiantum capillus-veneris]
MGGAAPPEFSKLKWWPWLAKHYHTPLFQISLIGFVCFCCPGMFNAVNGMGAGGQEDPKAADNGLTALYSTFAVFGLLGGGIYNLLGPHITLFFGCIFYILYVGSFLYYNHHSDQAFVIAAGALLGMGAGLLWAGQGAMMTAYPTPARKGLYISLFWCIFNLGGVAGGFIPFALNYHSSSGFVNDQTYVAFMCIMALGTLLTLALAKPESVIRDDGTYVASVQYPNVYSEIIHVLMLFLDWRMLLLAPACFASNFFYSYQFNNVNAQLFNVRTRAFNNVFYWGAQMIGSAMIGHVLDHSHKRRKVRGFIGCCILVVLSTGIWGGGLASQLGYSRKNPPAHKLDFKEGSAYGGPFVLYFSYGFLDAMFQTLCYWIIGALTNDARMLSRYSGFYKGVQSAGAAVAWYTDNKGFSYLGELILNWSLMTASFPLLFALLALAVEDVTITTSFEEEEGPQKPEKSIENEASPQKPAKSVDNEVPSQPTLDASL